MGDRGTEMSNTSYRPPRSGKRRSRALVGRVYRVPDEFMIDEDLIGIPGVDDEQHGEDYSPTERKRIKATKYYAGRHHEIDPL